jgi:putative CocE/NonD family hydrolase
LNPRLYESPEQYLATAGQHVVNALTEFQHPTLFNGLLGDPEVVHDGDFWKTRSPAEHAHRIQVPVFLVSGLRDIYQRGKPVLYEALKNHVPTKLMMGPWSHFEAGVGQGLPRDGVPTLDYVALQWFDHYLKGEDNGAERLPNVTQWVWGEERFVPVQDWPNPQARAQRLFLAGDGGLTVQAPQGNAGPRMILQQPLNGLCSQSASQVSLGLLGLTQLPCFSDDRLVNTLELVYETEPLTEPLYLDGPIQADLWVSSTAQDAGLAVRVSDVAPDGSAFNLGNGMLQLSHRALDPAKSRYLDGQMIQPWHPFTSEAKQAPGSGEIVAAAVEVWPVSALLKPGHRLRVAVGPSNFPYGLPPLPDLLISALGVLSVYNDAEHPSSVVLPVVPASNLGQEE